MCIPYLFIHSSADGYLGCFQFLAVTNRAALNVHSLCVDFSPFLSENVLLNFILHLFSVALQHETIQKNVSQTLKVIHKEKLF